METTYALESIDPSLLAKSEKAVASVPCYALGHSPAVPLVVTDPASGQPIAKVADYGVEDALSAVTRAHRVGGHWAGTTPRHRSEVLHTVYDVLQENRDRLALVIAREMGKPLAEAYGEVQYASDYVRWYADELLRPAGNYREAPSGGSTILTRRAPVGLSLLISPWNFPMAMITRKVAPAVAAGCAAVIKPASLTPLTTLLTVSLFIQAGVPPELLQVITTSNSAAFSAAVLADPRIRKISFTGSTEVGTSLMKLAAQNVVKSSMELGGNAPFIVFDDADLERAVDGAVAGKLRNGGQSCVAPNRFLIQAGIADDFVELFTERMRRTNMGNPLSENTQLGPMIDQRAVERLGLLVAEAVADGADTLTGGEPLDRPGHFFPATVLDNVSASSAIARTEIFGPVASITRFKTEDQAITLANDTPFGLAGYVFTESLDRAFNVADALETGLVGINQGVPTNVAAPFGGIKASGLGREGSGEGLEEYQEIRYYNVARRITL